MGAMTGPWTAHAGATLLGGTITLVEGSSFCLSSPSGDVLPGLPHGLIYRDTRFVSDLRLRINGRWPESLGALTLDPFSASFVLRDPPQPGLADSQLLITRHRYVGRGMRDDWYPQEKFEKDLKFLKGATKVESMMLDAGHEWSAEFREAAGEFLRRI